MPEKLFLDCHGLGADQLILTSHDDNIAGLQARNNFGIRAIREPGLDHVRRRLSIDYYEHDWLAVPLDDRVGWDDNRAFVRRRDQRYPREKPGLECGILLLRGNLYLERSSRWIKCRGNRGYVRGYRYPW